MSNESQASTRRILLALGISLLVHFFVLLKTGGLSPADPAASRSGTLLVALRGPDASLAKPDVAPTASVLEVESALQEPMVSKTLLLAPATNGAAKLVKQVAQPSANPVSQTTSLPRTESSPKIDKPSDVVLAGDRSAVRQVDIEFDIFSGIERASMGMGRHQYVAQDGENYGLSVKQILKTEDSAQALELWQLDISGRITPQGLSPLLYETHGALPVRLMALKGGAEVSSSIPNKTNRGRMPDGILDRQSLLYQFIQNPPVEKGGKLWLTDGTKHGTYTYRVEGAETLGVDSLGEVATVKLLISSSDSNDKIELWLMPSMRFLPAKVRHTDERGVITEQVVVSVSLK